MEELLKLIPDFPDYVASNTGLIFNLRTGKVLQGAIKKTGYHEVCLKNGDTTRYLLVHRIIAELFCDRPFGTYEVNHKDGNKSNNCAGNLEWVTHGDNLKHAYENGLREDNVTPKAVVAISMEDGTRIEFPSIYKAARFFGISQGNICMCCKGARPYANGYYWQYMNIQGE